MNTENKRARILSFILFVSSLFVYLEWGHANYSFIILVEIDLISKAAEKAESFFHPFILLPFCGQLCLLWYAIRKNALKLVGIAGLTMMSVLILMILLVGLLSRNFKIVLSVLPFLVTGVLFILSLPKKRKSISLNQ